MKTVLFGTGSFASLAWYCLQQEGEREVVGFAVDGDHKAGDEFHDLPVVAFEDLPERFPPDDNSLLLSLGPHDHNRLRRDRYLAARKWGYRMPAWVSRRASTWPDLDPGDNTMIFESAVIQPFARIGANCILRAGVNVSHHARIADHCFLSPSACIGGNARLGERVFVGLNATVLDNVTVAEGVTVAAGAVVRRAEVEDALYAGVPAVFKKP